MERELDDVNKEYLDNTEVDRLENRRLEKLEEARINEGDVLKNTNEQLNTWNSYFQENITRGKDDVNFVIRDQWTAVERSEFTRLFKPCMTFNKLYDTVKKILGEQRQNQPDFIVRSLNGKANQAQIDLRADLLRTISYQSQSDLVYQTAFKSALLMGWGAFQICMPYESNRSFNKVIRQGLINDPTLCSWDPTAIKPHKGDGNWCSRSYIFTRDEFFATYPYVTNPVSFMDPYMLLDFQWTTRDTIIVCENFVKEWFPLEIYLLSNGESVTKEEWKKREKRFEDNMEMAEDSITGEIIKKEIPTIRATRQTEDYKIMHYRMTRDQIIDFAEWPSRHLPIIFVDGDSYYIEGRQYTKSFIHEARDAQKCINYFNSEIAAEIKNRRREQWLATPDNIIGNEQQWRNPELQLGALIARVDPKTGQLPTKQAPWELSQQLVVNSQRAGQDIKEILGFSEVEQLQGRDVSGKARRERKLEGSMSAMIFRDNLNQAIEQAGRVINDLLPYIAGEDERIMTLTKKDGSSEKIVLNQMTPNGSVKNQLLAGDFDIEIDTGPSFAVQKSESLDFFSQIIQAYPNAFPLIADLYAKNLDLQWMPMIAERFQTLVPPEILAKEKGQPPPPPKPNPQEQMMQLEMATKQAEMQEKQANIQVKNQELELKRKKNELDGQELMLKAQKMELDRQLDIYNHQANIEKTAITHNLDHRKSELDYKAKIAAILADLHKSSKQHEHEKEMGREEKKEEKKNESSPKD